MQLSKKQKLEAYTYALLCALSARDSRLQGNILIGVCINLDDWAINNEIHNASFPEFVSQRPANKSFLWWPCNVKGMDLRIAAIERAIHLTEQL